MGKGNVQERMCMISRFIDQKMKSEEFPKFRFCLTGLHREGVGWLFSVFPIWLLGIAEYFL
jgi:hypothetical protein